MNHGKSISDFQKRFTHLINHLVDLGRKYKEEELNLKVLQCSDRSWQAKVTAIEESKDLTSLTLATFFGKLREHEQICEDSSSEDSNLENFNLMVKILSSEDSTSSYNCFEYGKPGHIKAEWINLLKKQQEEKKGKKNYKEKRAYIVWEDNDSSTTSDESEIEEDNLCLMAGDDQDTIECLIAKSLLWHLDSGCSRHMTGDPSKFLSLKLKNEGFVTYDDNNKGKILGYGNIEHGINHNFSTPRTPQQNGVVERKNRSLEELARTMLNETKLPKYFWADAINTTCYSDSDYAGCRLDRKSTSGLSKFFA
uniref:Retrovirus-related Pol polyprotein from transposon TNT 1-94 n=1 Tax=Cajanus cajan TaxID=3821 RepID=A0A151QN36_CAJCA|nr:Retrovirus-related Pol polyprotein from transposon TNT 1-94 [Cajanus cajan]